MQFHLPKPLHGWREFAGEVGIIVIGVLIALAAQEVAQYYTDRSDVAQLRQSMRDELAIDRARWEAVHSDIPCATKILQALDVWPSRPSANRVEEIVPPAMWTMHDSAWQIAKSSPKMSALPLHERDDLADLYFALEFQQRRMEKAQDSWNRAASLAKTADQPTSRSALSQAASEAQLALKDFDSNFEYVEQRFKRLGIRSDASALGASPSNYGDHCPRLNPL